MSELKIEQINKSYSKVQALKDFSATLTDGIYALLGPNGAGKSTLMNIISDNLNVDSGCVTFNGEDIYKMKDNYRDIMGYMPQHQGIYKNFTVTRFLWYISALKDVKIELVKQRIPQILQQLELSDAAYKKLGALSGGMLRRLCLAQALLNDPKILILDEPTAGLDPMQRINLRNYIAKIAFNKIVIIATHVVSDIEFIAKEIMILKNGVLVDFSPANKLIENVIGKVWEIRTTSTEKVLYYQQKFKVGNIMKEGQDIVLRIIYDTLPEDNATPAQPTLEDYYLYTFETVGGGV